MSLHPFPCPTSLHHHSAPGWAPCVKQQLLTSYLFTHGSVCILILLSPCTPLFPSPTVSISPFSTSVSPFLFLQIASSIYFVYYWRMGVLSAYLQAHHMKDSWFSKKTKLSRHLLLNRGQCIHLHCPKSFVCASWWFNSIHGQSLKNLIPIYSVPVQLCGFHSLSYLISTMCLWASSPIGLPRWH